MKYKKGDWLFQDFELKTVNSVSDNGYWLSNGIIECGCIEDERCFPLDKKIKVISDEYYNASDKLHAIKASLNHPDIHRWLENEWIECCQHIDNDKYVEKKIHRLWKFVNEIRTKAQEQKHLETHGVRIF